jgi:hypothetical protein
MASIQMVPDEQIKITTNLVKIIGTNLRTGLGSIDRQLGSNATQIAELQAGTNHWNAAYTYMVTNRVYQDATNAVYTNWIGGILVRTNDWNAITNATNQIIELRNQTNYWNGGGTCSARVDQLEARTNVWNTAATNQSNISNRFEELEIRTNDWNYAYDVASSNEVHEYILYGLDSNTTINITGTVAYAVYRTSTTNSIRYFQCNYGDQIYTPMSTNIYVEMWAGGGGGNANISGVGYGGGGGAFISGYLSVTQGESLVIVVGAGGTYNASGAGTVVYGGGGAGLKGGDGGGRSAVRRGSIDLVTAGAGGGGFSQSTIYYNYSGGPGGISTGTNGNGVSLGYGGSQIAGGSGSLSGSLNSGGSKAGGTGGGAGGSGYYGGGAGTVSGGGGGSSLTNGFYQVGTCEGGTGYWPGGTNATYFNNILWPGFGGAYSTFNGHPGYVVIREEPFSHGTWIQQTPNIDYTLSMTFNSNTLQNIMTFHSTNGVASNFKIYYRD